MIKVQFRGEYIAYKEGDYATYIGMRCRDIQGNTLIMIDAANDINHWLFPPHDKEVIEIKKLRS